jgi:hypothetical protein
MPQEVDGSINQAHEPSKGIFFKRESYDKNKIKMILIYTNLLKCVCPLNLG